MEKISGILPSNSRLKSVDLKNSQPSRPGAPNFGQRMGSTSADRLSLSEEATERMMQETLAGYNPREARHAKIAEQMTRNFFETRLGPKLREDETTDAVSTGASTKATSAVDPKSAAPNAIKDREVVRADLGSESPRALESASLDEDANLDLYA